MTELTILLLAMFALSTTIVDFSQTLIKDLERKIKAIERDRKVEGLKQ